MRIYYALLHSSDTHFGSIYGRHGTPYELCVYRWYQRIRYRPDFNKQKDNEELIAKTTKY